MAPLAPQKVDVWSSGTMLFQMVCGVLPFQRAEDKQLTHMHRTEAMFKRVINAEYAFPPGVPVTEKFKSLIGCMLVTDPKKRFSVKEVMQHPWFVQDLVPGALLINKMLVQESKANAPSEEVRGALDDVPRHRPGRAFQPRCSWSSVFFTCCCSCPFV